MPWSPRPMRLLALFFALAAGLVSTPAAQTLTSGTYMSPSEAATITVEATAESITVVEPIWTSVYTNTGEGEYRYTSTRGNVYAIRVVGPTEFESYRPGHTGPGTTTPASRFQLQQQPTLSNTENEVYEAAAERYLALAESDPTNAHVWAACGAAAMARSSFDDASFEAYARQSAAMLKPIMASPGPTPCEDAIPAAVWQSVP